MIILKVVMFLMFLVFIRAQVVGVVLVLLGKRALQEHDGADWYRNLSVYEAIFDPRLWRLWTPNQWYTYLKKVN